MSFLATLLTLLLQALLPALVEASRSTASAASAEVALRERLRRQVHRTWPACARVLLFLLLLTPLGCATRTLYVPDGTPVRLRETVRAVKVWVVDREGQVIPGVMDLPEGWYALPDTPVSNLDLSTPLRERTCFSSSFSNVVDNRPCAENDGTDGGHWEKRYSESCSSHRKAYSTNNGVQSGSCNSTHRHCYRGSDSFLLHGRPPFTGGAF